MEQATIFHGKGDDGLEFQSFLESHRGKRVVVCGIGVSNLPLLRLLSGHCGALEARDRKSEDALGDTADELRGLGVSLRCGPDYLEGLSGDIIYRSPGMPSDLPEFVAAVERGAALSSEMEAFFETCPAPIIGITGSDGKTTTSTLIARMLEHAGHRVWLGGNIGTPLIDAVPRMAAEDKVVVELSSFQLMSMRRSPQIAVITNLAPNHLDIHKTMEAYVEAKTHILRHQSPSDLAVLNLDCAVTRSLAPLVQGTLRMFSGEGPDRADVFIQNGAICARDGAAVRSILLLEDIRLPGRHNVENYMAAIAALHGTVPDDAIREVAKTFTGVEHRLEPVRTVKGVRFYNDSIASSPTRTIAGLRAFGQKVILIAGGYDKQIPFEPLAEEIPTRVKHLVLVGATSGKIRRAVEAADGDTPPITMAGTFEEAVDAAYRAASAGDIVLLSPACAAFDLFENFVARGRRFKDLVNQL